MAQRKIFLLLCCVSFLLSTALAAPPREGVYEKTGSRPARMVVIEPEGRPFLQNLYAPLIGLEAFHSSGRSVQQLAALYSGKTADAGAGENWLELTGKELENALSGKAPFSLCLYGAAHPQKGREQIDFFFPDDGTAEVHQAGDALDGVYRYTGPEIKDVPLLLPLFAWKLSSAAPYSSRDEFPVWRKTEKEAPDTWHFLIGADGETELTAARDLSRLEERTEDS